MAHVELLTNNVRANEVRAAAKGHRVALDNYKSVLTAHVAIMTQMLTGASSDIESFAAVVAYYDIPGDTPTIQKTTAKLLFDEAASAADANASLAALKQFAAIVG